MSPNDIAGLVLSTLTIVTIVLGALGWWITTKIKDEIRSRTYQIQPGSNGGKSLSDLHIKVDSISDDVSILKKAVIQLEDDVEGLL